MELRKQPWIFNLFFRPVSIAPLVLFRIVFGALLFVECLSGLLSGWVKTNLVEPGFTFTFIGFEWLQPLPGKGMYFYYAAMCVGALMILLGLFYRSACVAFLLLWTGTYLMDKTDYNNHYYLIILLSLLMTLVPADANFSVDAWRKKNFRKSCPAWCIRIFQFQVAVVYVFAGINKLRPDWLMGLPVHTALLYKSMDSAVARQLAVGAVEGVVTFGGLLFDLSVVPLLVFRRTRKFGWYLLVFFHLFNLFVFQVGMFPFIMIALTAFFFPCRFAERFLVKETGLPAEKNYDKVKLNGTIAFIGLYVFMQLMLPLRHFFYEGNTDWTEEGHRMAWRMMLRIKTGSVYFKIKDPKQKTEKILYPERILPSHQAEVIAFHPDLLWQFAQRIKEDFQRQHQYPPQVYAYSEVSLNGRALQPFVDTLTNLANIPWKPFNHAPWIMPFKSGTSLFEDSVHQRSQ